MEALGKPVQKQKMTLDDAMEELGYSRDDWPTMQQMTKRYRELQRRYHPDRCPVENVEEMTIKASRLNRAREIIARALALSCDETTDETQGQTNSEIPNATKALHSIPELVVKKCANTSETSVNIQENIAPDSGARVRKLANVFEDEKAPANTDCPASINPSFPSSACDLRTMDRMPTCRPIPPDINVSVAGNDHPTNGDDFDYVTAAAARPPWSLVLSNLAVLAQANLAYSPQIAIFASCMSKSLIVRQIRAGDKLVVAGETVRLEAGGLMGSVTRRLTSQGRLPTLAWLAQFAAHLVLAVDLYLQGMSMPDRDEGGLLAEDMANGEHSVCDREGLADRVERALAGLRRLRVTYQGDAGTAVRLDRITARVAAALAALRRPAAAPAAPPPPPWS